MLSRVADALYWMGRYIERAEHGARVLDTTRALRLDLNEVDRAVADAEWRSALDALSMPDHALERLVFEPREPTSLLCALSRARENARQVREVISPEMWESLNRSYWALRETAASSADESVVSETLGSIVTSSFLWDGVTDSTMNRGEGWLFLKLGKFVERADETARMLAARERTDLRASRSSGNVLWISLLKSLEALDSYRKTHPTRVDRRAVVEFVLFDREFPRSLLFSTRTAAEHARTLLTHHPETGKDVARAFGRIAANVEYTDSAELERGALERFLRHTLEQSNVACTALQKTFFLC